MLANALPEGRGDLGAMFVRTGAVAHRACHVALDQQASLVANRHRRATARLTDNAGGWPIAIYHGARAPRGRSFFLDCTDHHDRASDLTRVHETRCSTDESRQWPFSINCATPVEHTILNSDRNIAVYRVHMP